MPVERVAIRAIAYNRRRAYFYLFLSTYELICELDNLRQVYILSIKRLWETQKYEIWTSSWTSNAFKAECDN